MPQIMLKSFNAGEITPGLFGRVDLAKYASGLKTCLNMVVHPHGGASKRSGFEYIATAKNSAQPVALIPFQFNRVQTYMLELGEDVSGNGYIRFYMDGGQIESGGSPYELVNGTGGVVIPWDADDVADIRFCQSADVMFLVHPNWPIQELTRTGHTAWTIGNLTIGPEISTPTGLATTVTGSTGTTYRYKVTAVNEETGEESLPTSLVTASAASVLNSSNYVTLDWNAVTDADRYYIYREYGGTYGYLGSAETNQFVDQGAYSPDTEDTPPISRNPFNASDDYPSAITFHQQRLVPVNTNNMPQTIFTSQIANYYNFNRSFPLKDSDAATWTLAANGVDAILWVVSLKKSLVMGTPAGEWAVIADSTVGLSPASPPEIDPQSYYGSDPVDPVVIGNVVLFVRRHGKRIHEFVWDYVDDGYKSEDLLVLAEHLTIGKKIIQLAYQQDPDSIVWAITDDGGLLGMTFNRAQEVAGWHRHETTVGTFESIAVIPEDGQDYLWAVVNRTINGSAVRYIERLKPVYQSNTAAKDCFFVDAGATFYNSANVTNVTESGGTVTVTVDADVFANGQDVKFSSIAGDLGADMNGETFEIENYSAGTFDLADTDGSTWAAYTSGGLAEQSVTTVSGLSHLEGETVSVLANGIPVDDDTVSSGSVTLVSAAEKVQVGLGYNGDLETLSINNDQKGSGVMGRRKLIHDVTVKLRNANDFQFGADFSSLFSEIGRTPLDPLGVAIEPYDFTVNANMLTGYLYDARVCIRQPWPLPMTVLSIIPEMEHID